MLNKLPYFQPLANESLDRSQIPVNFHVLRAYIRRIALIKLIDLNKLIIDLI